MRSKWGGSAPAIRNSLGRKSLKYGTLGAPYVIAVNSISEWGTERFEILDALFGQEEVVSQAEAEPQLVRVGEGFFSPSGKSVNKRVSAAIVGTVWPWAPAASTLTVYHNPWAVSPLGQDALSLPQVVLQGARLQRVPGQPLHTILGLAEDWPQAIEENVGPAA